MKKTDAIKQVNEEKNFEDYLGIISQCLEKLEDENLSLNEGLKFYQEGMENLQKAQKILENAQLQCEELKTQYKKEEQ
ncbi:exodeoxyribonuclease VII small subunit [Helicobacter sp. MIT 05-5294]|uniref:exodeoxyribonuclease VII small subunit n=1 Tax=Helicobacter sp. MIT 05-5294 TaxID=1548150 RepID=UPI00051FD1FC|nr:exodeoxyribonuclease VII small subunit [Helicobacter sp. MIT 05-5294]TLD87578.1 exodeoxyribonuclease VII small subunit [Helicobacter sp. MIT 05-5294]